MDGVLLGLIRKASTMRQPRTTADDAVVEVIIDEDNPTTRSFLARLPMTLPFSDYGGKEKIATPTGEWDFTDAEGLDPKVGTSSPTSRGATSGSFTTPTGIPFRMT
jgi:hypothetical protein